MDLFVEFFSSLSIATGEINDFVYAANGMSHEANSQWILSNSHAFYHEKYRHTDCTCVWRKPGWNTMVQTLRFVLTAGPIGYMRNRYFAHKQTNKRTHSLTYRTLLPLVITFVDSFAYLFVSSFFKNIFLSGFFVKVRWWCIQTLVLKLICVNLCLLINLFI